MRVLKLSTFAASAALALSACASPALNDDADEAAFGPAPETEQACAAAGGRWARGGMLGHYHCFRAPPDAGQSCTDSTQCEGLCELNEAQDGGSCSRETPVFGCIALYEGEGDAPTICID